MPQIITKRVRLSRRLFLKGLTAAHVPVIVGVPPLISMFNSTGTAYAAEIPAKNDAAGIGKRFVVWFNGNGIPERYWIPSRTGADYDLTPREIQVARLIAEGLSNSEIAERLGVKFFTARNHVERTLAKLGVPSRHRVGPMLRNEGSDAGRASAA